RLSDLLLDSSFEHLPGSGIDPAVELLARDVQPHDERRMACVLSPEPVAPEGMPRLCQLESADHTTAVIRVNGGSRLRVELGEKSVRVLGALLVVDRVPALACTRCGCRGNREVGKRCAEVQPGAADDHR